MYCHDSASDPSGLQALKLLESAAAAPAEACGDDPEVQAAFERSLRELAEDIVQHHPGLAHLLLGMSESPCPLLHGRN